MNGGAIVSGVRAPRQRRSETTRRKIVEAAIDTLTDKGVAGLTHRAVAARANVSLAATTYYYATRFDIVADASRHLLNSYLQDFRRFAARQPANPISFSDFISRLLHRAAGRDRRGVTAWCEIMLNAARHSELRPIAIQWYGHLAEAWRSIATALGDEHAATDIEQTMDTVCGLILIIVALRLSEDRISAILNEGLDPLIAQHADSPGIPAFENSAQPGKGARTREAILSACIALFVSDGPSNLTHHAIAAKAGVSMGVPAYHFRSIDALIGEARTRLFQASKDRRRNVMLDFEPATLERTELVDLTATIFIREATEFAGANLAILSIWIEAGRNPELRPAVCESIMEQDRTWKRMLSVLTGHVRSVDTMLVQAFLTGNLFRMLTTGTPTSGLVRIRRDLDRKLGAIVTGAPCSGSVSTTGGR